MIILPVDDISNACAEAVYSTLKEQLHYLTPMEDCNLSRFRTTRTMIGTGRNPNVAAVIVIGIEPKWTKKIVDGIAEVG